MWVFKGLKYFPSAQLSIRLPNKWSQLAQADSSMGNVDRFFWIKGQCNNGF